MACKRKRRKLAKLEANENKMKLCVNAMEEKKLQIEKEKQLQKKADVRDQKRLELQLSQAKTSNC